MYLPFCQPSTPTLWLAYPQATETSHDCPTSMPTSTDLMKQKHPKDVSSVGHPLLQ